MVKLMRWRLVGFKHPEDEMSRLYKHCSFDEDLVKSIKKGIEIGCNLFSIRGF